MKKVMMVSVGFAVLIASTLYADSSTEENAEQSEVRTLIITGSPILQSIEGSIEQLAEYDNQAIIDAGDLLTRFPGFSAIRAGGHAVDPVLRGLSQTRINLLQQGAFLHGAGPNRMDSPGSYTEPFGWDEIQIIKGVESLVFGSGGPAGLINFKRYSPIVEGDGVTGKMVAVYSSDYYKLGADLAMGNEEGYIRLISQLHDQDSYEDGDGNITRTAFKTKTNTVVAGFTPDENTELRLSIMMNRGTDALFAGTMMDGPVTDMDAAQLLYLDGDQTSNNYSEYQYYKNDAHHMMDNYSLRTQTSPMRMLTDSYSETEGLKWLKRWQDDKTIWQASFDWQNVSRHAERYMGMMGEPTMLQANIWPDNELDIKGFAIEGEYRLDDDRRIKSGVRYDRVEANSAALESLEAQSLYQNYYSSSKPLSSAEEDNVSAFSRYYQTIDSALFWIGISSTVRTADATERYLGAKNNMAMMQWVGNPFILPERHNQLELGAKWYFEGGWHELNVYYDGINDFILRDRARGQDGIIAMDMATIYRNTDTTLKGFEWSLSKDFSNDWSLYTNLAYVKGTVDDTGEDLYQIPPVEGLIRVSNDVGDMAYWLDVRWALSQENVDDSMMSGSALDAGESDAWVAVDFKVRYQLADSWQLSAGINNVLDETYAYHVSRGNMDPFNPEAIRVNEPGRNLWVSVIADF